MVRIAGRQWIVKRDQHHRSRPPLAVTAGRQARKLHARLIDEGRRENDIVGVGNGISVSRLAEQRFCQTIAAAKLPQIILPAQLVKNGPVVQVGKLVIDARSQGVILNGGRDTGDKRRDAGSRVAAVRSMPGR